MRLLGKALTFDDVLLVPAYSQVLPRDTASCDCFLPQHPPEPAARLGSDGHRDRSAPGDRDRARGRHRHRAQEHEPRSSKPPRWRESSATSRVCCAIPITIGPDVTVREVMELSRQHGVSGFPVLKGKTVDRHRHQSRPALRDAHGHSGARDHDAARASHHREGRRVDRRRQGADAQTQARARAGRQRRVRVARPDDGEGHHQADELSERRARRAGQAESRRRGRRGRGHRRARRPAREGRCRCDRRRYRARPQRRRHRSGALDEEALSAHRCRSAATSRPATRRLRWSRRAPTR